MDLIQLYEQSPIYDSTSTFMQNYLLDIELRIDKNNPDVRDLFEYVKHLQNQLDESRGEIERLEDTIDEGKQEIEHLEDMIKDLEIEVDLLNKDLERCSNQT